tara:strand:+ start:1405 stop:1656 length:252 start_codon:yes stop_codon:yes gene_type:complete
MSNRCFSCYANEVEAVRLKQRIAELEQKLVQARVDSLLTQKTLDNLKTLARAVIGRCEEARPDPETWIPEMRALNAAVEVGDE